MRTSGKERTENLALYIGDILVPDVHDWTGHSRSLVQCQKCGTQQTFVDVEGPEECLRCKEEMFYPDGAEW